MPRQATLRLKTLGTLDGLFKADFWNASILRMAGWTSSKKTKSYHFLRPPADYSGSKDICVTILVPTDEEMVVAADRIRMLAGRIESRLEVIDSWPFVYLPSHPVTTTYEEVDPFTLEPRSLPQVSKSAESEVCRIGFLGVWDAEVRWTNDHTAIMTKFPNCEVAQPQQQLDFSALTTDDGNDFLKHELVTKQVGGQRENYVEGGLQDVLANEYERSEGARRACLDHYGVRCSVCDFDFGEQYGDVGRGFIHVHHIRPLADIGGSYKVDPVAELRPVCPNCHAMLHRRNPPIPIAVLREKFHEAGAKREELFGIRGAR